jgi:hypothetical protein
MRFLRSSEGVHFRRSKIPDLLPNCTAAYGGKNECGSGTMSGQTLANPFGPALHSPSRHKSSILGDLLDGGAV